MTLGLEAATRLAINRRLLADHVYDRVLADIVTGRYAPHERLNVDLLAAEFGVSRTPVREGLARLQWDRFITIAPNSRTTVSHWGVEDMRNRLEVVTRLVTFIAQDPRIPLVALTGEWAAILDDHTSRHGSDTAAFLGISELLVSLSCNNVSTHVVRSLLRPLRLFLVGTIAELHEVDLRLGSEARLTQLRRGLAAAYRNDRHGIAAALERYSESLLMALMR